MTDEEEVERIVADWQELRDRGEAPPAGRLLEALAALAATLRARLDLLDRLHEALAPAAPSPAPTLRPLPAGRYADFRLIGEGGMGSVYWALDRDLNREVAFKVVKGATPGEGAPAPERLSPPPPDTPEAEGFDRLARRFLQEAWITAGLSHAGIAPVHDLGSTPEGVPYYTMRFVRGGRTLAQALAQASTQPLAQRLALLDAFLRVCDTIAYAHGQGVLHRDLKPENVALGEFGEVVVLDWGVAKVRGDPEAPTDAWALRLEAYRRSVDLRTVAGALGTPGYMAPEALRGDADALDERSDVYSLGAILYELLTGRRALSGAGWRELTDQALGSGPPRALDVDAEVPTALSELCARCLAREPEQRPRGVAELAQAVRAWQADSALAREAADLLSAGGGALAAAQQVHGPGRLQALDEAMLPLLEALRKRPGDPEARRLHALALRLREEAVRERERRSRRRLLRAVLSLLLLGGGLTALGVTDALRAERDAAVESRARAERAEQSARERLREMLLARARERRAGHVPGRRAEALDALAQAAAIRGGPEVAWATAGALALADVVPLADAAATPAQVVAQARSPDGRWQAWADADGHLHVRDRGGDGPDRVIATDGRREVWTLAFSAGAERLVVKYRGEGRLRVYAIPGGSRLWSDDTPTESDAVDLRPDGALVALARSEGRIELRRLADGALLRTRAAGPAVARLRFSPDGGCLAAVGPSSPSLQLLAVGPPWEDRVVPLPAPGASVAWAADGRHIAVGGEDEVVHVLRLDPGGVPALQGSLRGHRGRVSEVRFAWGSDLLLSGAWDDTLRVWDPWTGAERVTVRGFDGWLDCRSDDSVLSWVGPRGAGISSHSLEPGRVCRRLPAPGGLLRGCALAPDGSRVVAVGEREVHAWDPASGRHLGVLPGGGPWGLSFAPDGTLCTSGRQGLLRLPGAAQEGPGATLAPEVLLAAPPAPGAFEQVALSADGRTVAVADRSQGLVRLRTLPEGAGESSVRHDEVFSIALSPDGAWLATGTWHGQGIRLWDARSASLVGEVPTGDASFARLTFDATGRWLVVSDDHGLRTLGVPGLQPLATRPGPPRCDGLCAHPTEPLVAAGDEAGRIHLLSLPTLATRDLLEAESGSAITSLAFDRTGSLLAASSTSAGSVVLWDLRLLGAERRRLGLPDGVPPEAGSR